jgi:galactokinase
MLGHARKAMHAEDYERARHVISENQRTLDTADALGRGDFERSGTLMNASHESLRELYKVSSRELDIITAMAREHPACWGARMTGAGFGGCGVAMVRVGAAEAFVSEIEKAYREETHLPGALYVCRPVEGARLL